MCIIFSTGYIKIYNINSSNEYFIQQHAFVQSIIQYYTSKAYKIHPQSPRHPAAGTNELLLKYPSGYKLAKSR